MNNISIKNKLLIVVLVPIICMIVVAAMKVKILQDDVNAQSDVVELMGVSVAASNLVHEMQKERGASAGFIGSKGKKFADTLIKQRQLTNEKKAILLDLLSTVDTKKIGEKYNQTLDQALGNLEKN